MTAPQPIRRPSSSLRAAFFALLALEGLAALVWLAAIPPDPKNSFLWGYSLNRLAMMAVALAAALSAAALAAAAARRHAWLEPFLRPARYLGLALALLLGLACASWLALVLLRADPQARLAAYAARLRPLLLLAWLVSWQAAGWLWLERFGFPSFQWNRVRPWARPAALAGLTLVLLVAFMSLTGIGITPDLYSWNSGGVPLLAWQWAGAVLLGLLLYSFLPRGFGRRPARAAWLDVALSLLIWTAAVGAWSSQPVTPSYYAPRRPPNDAFYPYSDASYYDLSAQQMLIGNGYNHHQVVTRPLYILFLALAHSLAGQDYTRVITLQTLVLALFPVCLYGLGRAAHSRAVGVTLALLAVVRELNAFAATPLTEVSHSKLLLTDFPTALGVAGFTLLAMAWLRAPRRRWLPLAAGGALGFLAMLRAQIVIFAPFVLLAALPVYKRDLRRWLEAGLLLGLGLALAVSPWVARNYVLTGKVVFDQSPTQTLIFGQRFSMTANEIPEMLPGETTEQYSARMMRSAREFALQHPLYTARFMLAHFLNNEVATLTVLPFKFSLDDYRDTLALRSVFWAGVFNHLTWSEALALAGHLALIAAGIGYGWRQLGPAGLLPLVLNLAYSLSNAIARNSGWRYVLPVDWVAVFYAVTGALALAEVMLRRAEPDRTTPHTPAAGFPWRAALPLAAGLLAFGAVIPLAELVFPRRFQEQDKMALAGVLAARAGVEISLPTGPNSVLLHGLAFYPRFYYPGQGELGSGWPVFAVREEKRLAFILVGAEGNPSILLALDKEPQAFPNASEVLIMGCRRPGEAFVRANLVLQADPPQHVYRSADFSNACP